MVNMATLSFLTILALASQSSALSLSPPKMNLSPSTPDLVVVGGGSAGLTAAKFGARFGKKVMLVEKARLGGDCTWTGCLPSKSLIAAAKNAHTVRNAHSFGVKAEGGVSVDWKAVQARLRRVVERVYDEDDSPQALRELGIEVVEGAASFVDSDGSVLIDTSGHQTERATKPSQIVVKPKYGIVVATGARPDIPAAIDGLGDESLKDLVITYEEVFELEKQPEQMTVIGGGPIGCELAQAFQRLGTAVTLVAPRLLPGEDPSAGELLERVFAAEGVTLLKGRAVKVSRADIDGTTASTTVRLSGGDPSSSASSSSSSSSEGGLEEVVVGGDVVLVAVGRSPALDSLRLENARVDTAAAAASHSSCGHGGGIVVDAQLRTSNKRVFAAGDCVEGAAQHTHVAGFQGAIAARNLLLPLSDKGLLPTPPPAVTFTSPEVARVGVSEEQAVAEYSSSKISSIVRPLSKVDRALCDEDEPEGFIKIVYRKKDGCILGALVVAPCAGELASELGVAIASGLSLPKMASVMHSYPSYAIALQQMAAEVYYDTLEKSMPLYNTLKKLGL